MADSNVITLKQLRMSLNKIKEQLDGKANTEHEQHVLYLSTVKDLVPGEAGSAGTAIQVARADHAHAIPAYPTELKSPGRLTVFLNDVETLIYDGSVDLPLDISYAEVGASPVKHDSSSTIYGISSASVYGHSMASSTTPKVAGSATVGTETAKFARGDHVHPVQTTVSGNAGSATKLQTARTLTIGSYEQIFDGTKDLEWPLSDIGGAPTYHAINGSTYGLSTASVYGHAKASSTTPLVASSAAVGSETATFARGDHVHPAQTSVSGNAGTATKLQTARTLTIGNSGKSFNGSANVSWSLSEIGAASIASVEQATDAEIDNILKSILK